jgi:hypothetical protein
MPLAKYVSAWELSEILAKKHGIKLDGMEIIEFLEDGMPHFLLDRTTVLFREKEAKAWIEKHLLERVDTRQLPSVVNVFSASTGAAVEAAPAPAELSLALEHLSEFPVQVYRRFPCVYFLVKRDRVVYVGSTVHLGNRILSHLKGKDFDRLFFMRAPQPKIYALEVQFIKMLKPPLNHPSTYDKGFHDYEEDTADLGAFVKGARHEGNGDAEDSLG